MKKIIIIIASALVVIGVAIFAILGSQPSEGTAADLKAALSEMGESLSERDELRTLISLLEYGSVEVDGKIGVVGNPKFKYNLYFGGKLYIESDAEEYMIHDAFYRYGKDGDEMELYLGPDYAYIDSKTNLGGIYGLIRGDMANELAFSPFAPSSMSEYSVGSELFDPLHEMLRLCDQNTDKELAEDMRDFSEDVIRYVYKDVIKDSEINYRSEEYRELAGEKSYVSVTDFTADEEKLLGVIEMLVEFLDERIEELKSKYGRLDLIERMESVREDAQSLLDSRREAKDKYIYTLSLMRSVDTGEAVGITLTRRPSSAPDSKPQNLISLEFNGSSIAEATAASLLIGNTSIVYRIVNDNDKKFECVLQVDGRSLFELEIYKSYDNYCFTVYDVNSVKTLELYGEWHPTDVGGRFTVNNVYLEDGLHPVEITVLIDTEDSMPKPEKSFMAFFGANPKSVSELFITGEAFDGETDEDETTLPDNEDDTDNGSGDPSTEKGEALYGVYSSKYLTLTFKGRTVVLTAPANDGKTFVDYEGSYRITEKNGEKRITFSFKDSTAYNHFERGGETLVKDSEGIIIGGKVFIFKGP